MRRRPTILALILGLHGLLALSLGAAAQTLSISDIQYTVDSSGSSPEAGNLVTVEGIVYATYGSSLFAVADDEGPWNGILVYNPNPAPGWDDPVRGDEVQVIGRVEEYFGRTEIHTGNTAESTIVVLSQGQSPYPASVTTTASLATGADTAESYEGVLVEVQVVGVTDTNPDSPNNYGEWMVDDGSGGLRVDDLASYSYDPLTNDQLLFVRGMLEYSFDNFKIEPRDDEDISATSGTATPYSIPEIQGSGFASPVQGQRIVTSGVVTGFFEGNIPGGGPFDAVFLQDANGDGSVATSDGIVVIHPDIGGLGLLIGTTLEVEGVAHEYSEWDGAACAQDCMTAIIATDLDDQGGHTALPAVTLDPPTDHDDENDYLEAREGMMVAIDGPGRVVGPTNFGTIGVVDEDESVSRVLRGSPQHGKVVGVRHYELYGKIGGGDPPNLIVGSSVSNLDGPLMTTYGDYVIVSQGGDAWSQVTSVPPPAVIPHWPGPGSGRLTAATLNGEQLDLGDARLPKIVDSIVALGCPTFLSLQEVDLRNAALGDGTEVLSALLSALDTGGCAYSSYSFLSDVGGHGVAVLWRTDQVTNATGRADVQGCSAVGSQSAEAYDSFCDLDPGHYPLFSRRPVIVDATVDAACPGGGTLDVTVIGLHLKSKLGGAASAQRRLEQAELVASLVTSLVALGQDRVLVLGDLNDFEDSAPLQALQASGELDNLWSWVPGDDVFSYNYRGVCQALDHVLYSAALSLAYENGSPVHHNADFPFRPYGADTSVVWRASDHDPVVATFDACAAMQYIFADGFESGASGRWSSSLP